MLAFIIVFLSANIFTVSADNSNTISAVELLSLSDSELVSFLKERGVDIPGNPDEEENWGEFIKSTITCIVTNPNGKFLYSDTVLIDFANDIKTVLTDIGAVNLSMRNSRSNGTLLYYVCSVCDYRSSFIPVQPSAMPDSIRSKLTELASNGEENNSIFIENMEFCYIDGQYYYVSEFGDTTLPAVILQEGEIH